MVCWSNENCFIFQKCRTKIAVFSANLGCKWFHIYGFHFDITPLVNGSRNLLAPFTRNIHTQHVTVSIYRLELFSIILPIFLKKITYICISFESHLYFLSEFLSLLSSFYFSGHHEHFNGRVWGLSQNIVSSEFFTIPIILYQGI